jgi:magnesium chelatase subunit I
MAGKGLKFRASHRARSADGASSFHSAGGYVKRHRSQPRNETPLGTRRLVPMTPPEFTEAADLTETPAGPPPDVTTLGQLKASGWQPSTVAAEIRRNAAARIAAGQPLVRGVLGFEDTVLPQLENAVLAGHDIILLGERGQAKTRLIRSLVSLLDEWLPIVAHSEINDDPFAPVSRYAKDLVAEQGDETPISWVPRRDRYGEKLATPDTSIADLIGEVDPIRVAEGRYLSDELTIHYGLVPRLNRGIFAVNELPDLAERIQVGLLNVLEERDVQIRGHRVRLPLDIMLVATANPEDYTNRGRIITPLKDRFGAQIRTHYPPDAATELAIARMESYVPGDITASGGGVTRVEMPDFMAEVVAELSQLARQSPHLNQRSGVSVRLTIANYETLTANATRRALRAGESEAVPRVSDLQSLVSSTQGKVEIETLEEGREELLMSQLVSAAVLTVFRRRVRFDDPQGVVAAFSEDTVVHAGDDLPSSAYAETLTRMPVLSGPVLALAGSEDPAVVASALEFVLEGLHLTKRLNKEAAGPRATYRGRG